MKIARRSAARGWMKPKAVSSPLSIASWRSYWLRRCKASTGKSSQPSDPINLWFANYWPWSHYYRDISCPGCERIWKLTLRMILFSKFQEKSKGISLKQRKLTTRWPNPTANRYCWGYFLVPSCCQTADLSSMEEFAYNIRYVEKHGRDLKNPWLVRHMAVYHRFNAEKKSSKWILLHPSAIVCQQLEKVVSDVACHGPADRRFLHLTFLWITEKKWREYVNYLQKEFTALVCIFPCTP